MRSLHVVIQWQLCEEFADLLISWEQALGETRQMRPPLRADFASCGDGREERGNCRVAPTHQCTV